MSENDQSEIHNYDGIEEQNNPMPDWWIWLFILCVIFSSIYWLHYQFGGGQSQSEEYAKAIARFTEEIKNGDAVTTPDSEESLIEYMKIESAVRGGAEMYSSKCAMCHGEHLEGKIGPNLTDQYWTTGNGSRMAIVHTINKGSAEKGMPPWESMLKPNDIKNVAAFIYSKIGSNPQNAKAPEGNQVKNVGQ
ncbi:MAG: cbb3-type cytochrome c oxidase N-terminal domain-containing protein [Bdellovibrionota bacterium]